MRLTGSHFSGRDVIPWLLLVGDHGGAPSFGATAHLFAVLYTSNFISVKFLYLFSLISLYALVYRKADCGNSKTALLTILL